MTEAVATIFKALSDPTRQSVIEQLSQCSASTSQLAESAEMSLPSFTQHLGILENCGLIRSQKRGRTRHFELAPARLDEAISWLQSQRDTWQARFDQLDQYALRLAKQPPERE